MSRWQDVLAGMRAGTLKVGSRTPVKGLPVWVTPDVIRGGFATGRSLAAGPMTNFERQVARDAGLPEDRRVLFQHLISDAGMRRLWDVLDAGRFEIDLPEAAALLVVAWLVREGHVGAALTLVEHLRPLAADLRFVPASVAAATVDPDLMWRESAGTVEAALRARRPKADVVRMNEVLDLWNPFADDLLVLWCAQGDDSGLDGPFSVEWLAAGRRLLDEYDRRSALSAPPARHTSPKENAAVLRLSLAAAVGGRELTPREHGRLRHAVDSMVAARGAPGSPDLRALRERQHAQAALPTTAAVAHIAAARLATAPPDAGLADVAPFVVPVTGAEAATSSVPEGTPMPRAVARALRRATSGTLDDLVESGVIPSAEVLATMVPQLTAQVVAKQYRDPALRVLMSRSYEAFRRRRTLLLLNLEHQVRAEELPWIAATAPWRENGATSRDIARTAFLRLADRAVTRWPGAILPNPLVSELQTLATTAGLNVPLVEEIAADIFTGQFSKKYATAFELAAAQYQSSLYARYYRIPPEALTGVRRAQNTAAAFGTLCTGRVSQEGHRWCVVCNGKVVEQAQILTTHNLASLRATGLLPSCGWAGAAEGAFTHVCVLVARLDGNPRPHRMIKDAAYAWRQMIYFVSQLDADGQAHFLGWARGEAERRSSFARVRLAGLLAGLAEPGAHDPLTGWGHGTHRLMQPAPGEPMTR